MRILVTEDEKDLADAIAALLGSIILGKHHEEEIKSKTEQLSRQTEELADANVKLQEADRLKSIFLASMSHELRTPLNSIIGFTTIIIDGLAGEINDVQRNQLGMVESSAQHLLGLINDVLDISKIEAGKVELMPDATAILPNLSTRGRLRQRWTNICNSCC